MRDLKSWILAIFITLSGFASATVAQADSKSEAASAAVFATDPNAGANAGTIVPGAAAIVDDHIIPLDDVIVTCLRKDRSYIIDQMIQSYVLDGECERRGIIASETEIDSRVADLRTNLAPATIEETLKLHHMTMTELRHTFKQSIERPLLVADQVKPVRMLHCREILVKCAFADAPMPSAGTTRTPTEAFEIVKDVQHQLEQGKNFEDLATRCSECVAAEKSDLGILYSNMLGQEASVLAAAVTLDKGGTSKPVKTADGYCLIHAISTDGDHAKNEESLYQDANKACRDLQMMFLDPKVIVGLIDQSKITFAKDEDINPGQPLPDAAAVIDGHSIPMQEVLAKCLAESGPRTVDILVQNYVVDRECERRGIHVSEVQIDDRVSKLREQVAPHTLDEALALHHTTMAGLRNDFRQEIERTRLVVDEVRPTRMVHVRAILVKTTPRTDAESLTLINEIQGKLKTGMSFEELAGQYSEAGDLHRGGDIGILYEGMHEMDTAVLGAALRLNVGEISPVATNAYGGHFLLQAVSTSDQHLGDEDAAYAKAFAACQNQKAQSLIPQVIVKLIKKSKVVYYVHS